MTGSTLALGAAVFANALPRVVVSSFAGVFVDRWERRHTMLVCDVLLGLGLLPLLLVRSAADLPLVAVVLVFESTVAQFYRPAEGALLPQVGSADELISANALNGLRMNAARLAGPALGALLVAIGGLPGVVLVDAASFLFAAATALIVSVKITRGAGFEPEHSHVLWRQWLAGLETVRDRVPALLENEVA